MHGLPSMTGPMYNQDSSGYLEHGPHVIECQVMAIDQSTLNALGVFASGYAKRFLESQYDSLAKTDLGQRLHGLDSRLKYGIEAALYAAMAYAYQRLPMETPIQVFLKELAMDFPSELSKRMINGDIPEGGAVGDCASAPLSELDNESLLSLARWLSQMTQEERVHTLARLAAASAATPSQPCSDVVSPERGCPVLESGSQCGSLLASATTRMEQARAAIKSKRLAMKAKRKDQ
mgnify:CR=1 FL=1